MLNIKKYILLSLLVTSNASAFDISDSYLKLGTGLNQINPIVIQTNDLNGKIKLSNKFPLIEAGIGSQLTDSIRTELVFDHYFLFCSEENSKNTVGDVFKVNYKTKISALMLNGYKNIITYGIFTPFVGGGIGVEEYLGKGFSSSFIGFVRWMLRLQVLKK